MITVFKALLPEEDVFELLDNDEIEHEIYQNFFKMRLRRVHLHGLQLGNTNLKPSKQNLFIQLFI